MNNFPTHICTYGFPHICYILAGVISTAIPTSTFLPPNVQIPNVLHSYWKPPSHGNAFHLSWKWLWSPNSHFMFISPILIYRLFLICKKKKWRIYIIVWILPAWKLLGNKTNAGFVFICVSENRNSKNSSKRNFTNPILIKTMLGQLVEIIYSFIQQYLISICYIQAVIYVLKITCKTRKNPH